MYIYIIYIYTKQRYPEISQKSTNGKQHLEAEPLLYENYSRCPSTLSSKNNRTYSEK